MAVSFQPIPTANPLELALRVDVPSITFDPSTMTPVLGTALKDCSSALQHRNNFWLDYTFSQFTEAPEGFVRLVFVKSKSVEERRTAYKTAIKYKDHTWPDVLKALVFQEDTVFRRYAYTGDTASFDGSAKVLASSWYKRKAYIPGCTYNSKVVAEYFLSDHTPFADRDLAHQQPVPTEIEWDFNGASGNMVCLHPEIRITSKGRPYQVAFVGALTVGVAAPVVPERVFPKTNFTSWAPFVLDDSQEQDPATGQWARVRYTIYPPPEPKIIIV